MVNCVLWSIVKENSVLLKIMESGLSMFYFLHLNTIKLKIFVCIHRGCKRSIYYLLVCEIIIINCCNKTLKRFFNINKGS